MSDKALLGKIETIVNSRVTSEKYYPTRKSNVYTHLVIHDVPGLKREIKELVESERTEVKAE